MGSLPRAGWKQGRPWILEASWRNQGLSQKNSHEKKNADLEKRPLFSLPTEPQDRPASWGTCCLTNRKHMTERETHAISRAQTLSRRMGKRKGNGPSRRLCIPKLHEVLDLATLAFDVGLEASHCFAIPIGVPGGQKKRFHWFTLKGSQYIRRPGELLRLCHLGSNCFTAQIPHLASGAELRLI